MQNPRVEQLINFNTVINDTIQVLTTKDAATEFTERESIHFESLKRNLEELIVYETRLPMSESLAGEPSRQ